jgi:ribosomal protein S12 methylthiotransferase accessory factor
MEVQFPGGMRVDALQGGLRIRTDQPDAAGGPGSAPSPFDLFLASIGTCAGFYALRFLQERKLETSGLSLSMTPEWDVGRRLVSRIRIVITLPDSFPEKYRDAILRAVDQCSVKRHLAQPPEFETMTIRSEAAVPA